MHDVLTSCPISGATACLLRPRLPDICESDIKPSELHIEICLPVQLCSTMCSSSSILQGVVGPSASSNMPAGTRASLGPGLTPLRFHCVPCRSKSCLAQADSALTMFPGCFACIRLHLKQHQAAHGCIAAGPAGLERTTSSTSSPISHAYRTNTNLGRFMFIRFPTYR